MFTGIVSDIGEVLAVEPRAEGLARVTVACGYPPASLAIGASISCAGICLTVVGAGEQAGRAWFAADTAAETLRLTTAGRWRQGSRINLERALRAGDELGGHIVSGHVDGLATVTACDNLPDTVRLVLRVPPVLAPFIPTKGSVALDGVSLTVNDVERETFSVLIIPHTLKVTTLGALAVGDDVNIEIDQMARYAARLMEFR
jgi:riboflavin synthase